MPGEHLLLRDELQGRGGLRGDDQEVSQERVGRSRVRRRRRRRTRTRRRRGEERESRGSAGPPAPRHLPFSLDAAEAAAAAALARVDHRGGPNEGGPGGDQNDPEPVVQVQPHPEQRDGENPGEDHERPAEHLVGARCRVEQPDVDQGRARGVQEGRGCEGGDGRPRGLPARRRASRHCGRSLGPGAQQGVQGQAKSFAGEHEGGLQGWVVEVDGLVGLGVPADDGGVLRGKERRRGLG